MLFRPVFMRSLYGSPSGLISYVFMLAFYFLFVNKNISKNDKKLSINEKDWLKFTLIDFCGCGKHKKSA